MAVLGDKLGQTFCKPMPVVCECGCACGRCSDAGCDCECHEFDGMNLAEIKDIVGEAVGLPPKDNYFACAKNKETLFQWVRDQLTSSQLKTLLKFARRAQDGPVPHFVPFFKSGTTTAGIKKRKVSNTYVKPQAKRAKPPAKKRACATDA